MDKVKLFQKLPDFLKTLIASARGYQLKSLRSANREVYLKEIKSRDTWTKSQIREFQAAKNREMLDYAVKHVPFYRNLWAEIHKTQPDLDHLVLDNWPILEKDAIRQNPEAFLSDEVQKSQLTHIHTSGTSGKPMNFWFDRYTISYWYALYEYRIRNWNGVKETDRWANIGGQLIIDINQKKPPFWTWNFVMNQLYFSSYHITPENTKYYIEALKKYKIEYMLGYVSSIYNIANEGLNQNLKLPKLKAVITNAEPLFEHQKEVIEKAFGCKAVQTYSSCEFVFGSNDDPESILYVWPEAGFVEVLKADGSIATSGTGQILTTGYLNKAMPLIRYRLGDTVTLNTGLKGKFQFDYFEEVVGRTDDMVLTGDGKLVGRLDPVFKANLKIKESQIIQEDYDLFTIKLVADEGFTAADTESIASRLRDRVGKNATVNFEMVDKIPRGPNGKFKAVVSKVKPN
jgi:phenylacetate-CoA ligase